MIELKECKLFKDLPSADLERLERAVQRVLIPAGEVIFKEGDPANGLYVVADGVVQISGTISTGQRQIYARVPAGDIFGEMAVLDELPRSATASAEEAAKVYLIPRGLFWRLLGNSPEMLLMLIRSIILRFRDFNRQYLETVLQAERMAVIGRFASSIVHDLKNPLTVINLAVETACMPDATLEMRAKAQERVFAQVERITGLVNDILDYTRGSQTSQIMSRTSYALFFNGLLAEMREELKARSVEVQLENPPPDVQVPLNPKRMRRVFYNLLGNAVDAMPKGGRISFRFEVSDTKVVTEIQDTGPGIEPRHLERVFQAFFTHGKPHGTGLGLAICQRIVREHQGTLTARNQPGSGAVFTIALPRTV